MSYYGTIDLVKDRLLIALEDDQYNSAIEAALVEASAYIDVRLGPYEEELPLEEPPDMINVIAADLASGIFKRRHMPQDMDLGWWGQGLRKLDDYIKNTYHKGVFPSFV